MTEETVQAMKKARAESKRALKSIEALLEYNFDGHTWDKANASRQRLSTSSAKKMKKGRRSKDCSTTG